MSIEAVYIKEEPEWDDTADSCGVSGAAAQAGLYADHVVKNEIMVELELLQPCDEEAAHGAGTAIVGDCKQEPVPRDGAGEQIVLNDCSVKLEDYALGVSGVCEQQLVPGPGRTDVRQNTAETHTYECDACGENYTDKRSLIPHVKLHLEESKIPNILVFKLEPHQPIQEENTLEYCKKQFTEIHIPETNNQTHALKKPYSCEVCKKQFKQLCHLKVHERIHTGEKPYSCETCKRKFAHSSALKKHTEIHVRIPSGEKEKPYSCELCKKNFADANYLRKHLRIHSGIKAYCCKVCNKQFTEITNLKVHERTHSQTKPYSCGICNKRFTQSSHLKSHALIHSGDKPHFCKICNKQFTVKSNLTVHERTHTNEKPYACGICKQRFTQRNNLNAHARIHWNFVGLE